MIENLYEVFARDAKSADEAEESTINATIFVFFHELGHALVNALELPITGKEEDAVDQLSTFILADGTDAGETAALDGAASFLSDEEEMDDLPFWDEHSLGQQRFFNIVCWVYGQNPDRYFSWLSKACCLNREPSAVRTNIVSLQRAGRRCWRLTLRSRKQVVPRSLFENLPKRVGGK